MNTFPQTDASIKVSKSIRFMAMPRPDCSSCESRKPRTPNPKTHQAQPRTETQVDNSSAARFLLDKPGRPKRALLWGSRNLGFLHLKFDML